MTVDGVFACKASDLDGGRIVRVSAGGRDVAVVRLDGGYYAFDDTCTHSGASLSEGRVDGCNIVCGWHAAEFDCRTGRLAKFPAKIRDLQAYDVVVESGDVFVRAGG